MAQSRRPSTSKHTPRQSAAELPDTLKNIQSLVASMTTPAKPVRRAVTQRSENQHGRPHLKETQPKYDSQNIKASDANIPENDGKDPAISHITTTVNAIRHVETERDGKRVVYSISLPTSQMLDVRTYLKELEGVEPSPDMGLTSKVSAETAEILDLDGTDENIAPPIPSALGHSDSSRKDSILSNVRETHGTKGGIETGVEIQQRGRKLMRAASIGPRPSKSHDMSSPEASRLESPEAPPTETAVPPVTPKRQIRLATSNSSAAEWFATGPTYSAKKKESNEPEIPIADVQATLLETGKEGAGSINVPETTIVNLLEASHVEPEIDNNTVESVTDKMAENLEISDDATFAPSEIADKPQDSTDSNVIVIEVNQFKIYFPYSHRSSQTIFNTTPTNPGFSSSDQTSAQNVSSETMTQSSSLVSQDEAPTDDISEDGLVVVKSMSPNEEADAVKRRWFREEMRQSPDRDGNWTVEENERMETEEIETSASIEQTISTVALDYILIESTVDHPPKDDTSVVQEPEQTVEPTVVPDILHVCENDIAPIVSSSPIVHVETTSPSADLHVETTAFTPSRPTQQKYIIVGGKVVPISSVKKIEAPVDLPATPDFQSSGSPKSQTQQAPHFAPDAPSHPPRKRFERRQNIPTVETTSDQEELGWSTEGEEESAVAQVAASHVEAPEMATEAIGIETVSQATTLNDTIPSELIEHSPPSESTAEEISTPPDLSLIETIESVDIVGRVIATVDTTVSGTEISNSYKAVDISDKPVPESHVESEVKPESAALEEKTSTKTDVTSSRYEIIKGVVVRKVSATEVKANVVTAADMPVPSVTSTPPTPSQTSSSQRRPLSRVDSDIRFQNRLRSEITSSQVPPAYVNSGVVPCVAEKFGYCGELADSSTIPKLIRENALWPGAPHYPGASPIVVGRTQEEPTSEVSQFFNGKTEPINQPSVRQEPFDPFGKESEKSLKQMRDKYPTVLESHDSTALKHLLSSKPHCFCGRPCTKFDGIVPVYVCGMFRQADVLSSEILGCAFHMHVPFWDCLRDTFHWEQYNKEKTFSSEALAPHLNACPYLNFTFCVKFSQCNNFNMYLPAEICANNTCACDLDLRLDFSQVMQQWVFSCPHYHQKGVVRKCVRRAFVQDQRYNLLENSANLHGGTPPKALDIQTVSENVIDDNSAILRPDGKPSTSVHLPHVDDTPAINTAHNSSIFENFYREATVSSAGSGAWLGDRPTIEQLATWANEKVVSEQKVAKMVEEMRERYLHLEKELDAARCQNIRDTEQRKREDARLRSRANMVTCLGCTETSAMCVFVPCYHMVMCERCAEKVKACPSCRRPVENRQRVYTA